MPEVLGSIPSISPLLSLFHTLTHTHYHDLPFFPIAVIVFIFILLLAVCKMYIHESHKNHCQVFKSICPRYEVHFNREHPLCSSCHKEPLWYGPLLSIRNGKDYFGSRKRYTLYLHIAEESHRPVWFIYWMAWNFFILTHIMVTSDYSLLDNDRWAGI